LPRTAIMDKVSANDRDRAISEANGYLRQVGQGGECGDLTAE
jgi:hypothetical protein